MNQATRRRVLYGCVASAVPLIGGCSLLEDGPPPGTLELHNESSLPHLCTVSVADAPDRVHPQSLSLSQYLEPGQRASYPRYLDTAGEYLVRARLQSGSSTTLPGYSFDPDSRDVLQFIIRPDGVVEWAISRPG